MKESRVQFGAIDPNMESSQSIPLPPTVGKIIKNTTLKNSQRVEINSSVRDMKKSSVKLKQHKFNEQVKNGRESRKHNLENTERIIEKEIENISTSIY